MFIPLSSITCTTRHLHTVQQCLVHLTYGYRGPIVVLTFRPPLPKSLMAIGTYSNENNHNVFYTRVYIFFAQKAMDALRDHSLFP